MVTGVLLSATASALPERWQEAGLYLGVGLTFATIGGVLLNLAMAARPEWRGKATVIGIVLGSVPLLVVAWQNLHSHPRSDAPALNSQAAAAPPPRRVVTAPPLAAATAAPQARSEAAPQATAAQRQIDPALTEVADVLNQKARPALSRAVMALTRGRMPALRSASARELESATGDLEEVRSSLRQIQSRHKERQGELAAVIGDIAPLDELISRLRELHDSLESATPDDNPFRQPGNDARIMTTPVDRWIAACNQRIVDQAKVLVTAS